MPHYAKFFSDIPVEKHMERFAPRGNFRVKVVHLQKSETRRSISKNSRFLSNFALSQISAEI